MYSAKESAAWQLARYGELWDKGLDELKQYNRMNKVEPLERGLAELGANTWFSGVRRQQSDHRKGLSVISTLRGNYKVHQLLTGPTVMCINI